MEKEKDREKAAYFDIGEESPAEVVFPVDLSREEYVEFNLLLAKSQGPLRWHREILLLTYSVIPLCLGGLMYLKLRYDQVNVLAVAALLLFILFVALPLIRLPDHLRRSASRSYDRTVQDGYKYSGRIYLEQHRIRKIGSTAAITINLDEKAILIENRDMLIVFSPGSRAIVIPARFLSPEDAHRVISRLHSTLDGEKKQVFSSFQPAADKPVQEKASSEMLLTLPIQYTPREFVSLLSDRALRTFLKRLPYIGSLCLIIGVLTGLLAGPLWGTATAVFLLTGLYLNSVERGRLRAKRIAARVAEEELFLRLVLTDAGLLLYNHRGEERHLPWIAVQRAVARPSCVEFAANEMFIRIPMRCIPDIQALKDIVDKHILTKNQRRR